MAGESEQLIKRKTATGKKIRWPDGFERMAEIGTIAQRHGVSFYDIAGRLMSFASWMHIRNSTEWEDRSLLQESLRQVCGWEHGLQDLIDTGLAEEIEGVVSLFPLASVVSVKTYRTQRSSSVVYFIVNRELSLVKIGRTSNIDVRLSDLQVANGAPLELVKTAPGGLKEERRYQKKYAELLVRGEWYRYEPPLSTMLERDLVW